METDQCTVYLYTPGQPNQKKEEFSNLVSRYGYVALSRGRSRARIRIKNFDVCKFEVSTAVLNLYRTLQHGETYGQENIHTTAN